MKVFLMLLSCATLAYAVRIENCGGSAKLNPRSIKISGCHPNERQCIFRRGTDANMMIPFLPPIPVSFCRPGGRTHCLATDEVHQDETGIATKLKIQKKKTPSTSLRAVVHGILLLRIPFPVPNENACHNAGLQCPLKPQKEVFYRAALPVRSNYPRVSVRVEWQLVDEHNDTVICIRFPARIV